jgi:hypothetical protein
VLRVVTSADDNGRFAIIEEFFSALWALFLCWELQTHGFGNAVACTSDNPV